LRGRNFLPLSAHRRIVFSKIPQYRYAPSKRRVGMRKPLKYGHAGETFRSQKVSPAPFPN
jgi:hypothetical protein